MCATENQFLVFNNHRPLPVTLCLSNCPIFIVVVSTMIAYVQTMTNHRKFGGNTSCLPTGVLCSFDYGRLLICSAFVAPRERVSCKLLFERTWWQITQFQNFSVSCCRRRTQLLVCPELVFATLGRRQGAQHSTAFCFAIRRFVMQRFRITNGSFSFDLLFWHSMQLFDEQRHVRNALSFCFLKFCLLYRA